MSEELIQTKIVRSNSYDPWFNLGLEEKLLDQILENEVILYLWQNDQTVVIGRNQNAWKECAWEQLEKDGGKLARRLSGGGTVFHDLGNLNFTFLAPRRYFSIERNLTVILEALKKLGINAEFSGRNDLLLDGKKFSGHAYYYQGQVAYHHGTILINSDLEKLSRYLKPSQKKIVSKGIESVRSRVVNIAQVSNGITVPGVMESFVDSFSEIYGRPLEDLTIADDDRDVMVNYDKYASWEWRFGQTPSFDLTLSERFPWGEIELGFRLQNGKIDSCTAYSDAMDEELVRRIPQVFAGLILKKENLVSALNNFNTDNRSDSALIISDLKKWLEGLEI